MTALLKRDFAHVKRVGFRNPSFSRPFFEAELRVAQAVPSRLNNAHFDELAVVS